MADNLADAVEVVIAADGDTFTSAVVSNVGYGLEAGEDDVRLWLPIYRTAWWIFRPAHYGETILDVTGSTGASIPSIEVFRGTTFADMTIAAFSFDVGIATLYAQTGDTYAIQIGSLDDEDLDYLLTVTGPRSARATEWPVPNFWLELGAFEPASNRLIDAPPALVTVNAWITNIVENIVVQVAAPTAQVVAVASPPIRPNAVDAPAAVIVAAAVAPLAKVLTLFVPSSPADGSTVPATRPVFVFGVLMGAGETGLVQLEYDDNEDFTAPVVIEFIPYTTDGTLVHRILAATDLADGTYWWQLRASDDDGQPYRTWQARQLMGSFTVDTTALSGAAAGSLTVTTGDPPARLWFTHPTSGVVGDPVTLYGIGLIGAGTETVTIDGIAAPVQSATQVPAGADAYTGDRIVEPDTPIVTVEHDEIVILVPDGTDEGGPLVLVRG